MATRQIKINSARAAKSVNPSYQEEEKEPITQLRVEPNPGRIFQVVNEIQHEFAVRREAEGWKFRHPDAGEEWHPVIGNTRLIKTAEELSQEGRTNGEAKTFPGRWKIL